MACDRHALELSALDPQAIELMNLINDYRADHGLSGLSFDGLVSACSQYLSDHMMRVEIETHEDAKGRRLRGRLCESHIGTTWYVENTAKSVSPDAQAVFTMWRDNSHFDYGHRRNMLDPRITALGLGLAHEQDSPFWFWTFTAINPGPTPPCG